ncbi:DUF4381 domain-containing protein [Alteromonas aestuariivivens]|nr:DUF4381 domain-containing protein [Alteromonas aestuariivivens]
MQTNPLDQLRDVHLPGQVDWWPLAWGWWLLAVVVLLVTVYAIVTWTKRRKFRRALNEAIGHVQQIDGNQPDWAGQLNGILKRISKRYFPNQQTASLYGERWLEFLLRQLPARHRKASVQQGLETLQNALYRSGRVNPNQFGVCQQACISWLKSARLGAKSNHPSEIAEASHV